MSARGGEPAVPRGTQFVDIDACPGCGRDDGWHPGKCRHLDGAELKWRVEGINYVYQRKERR